MKCCRKALYVVSSAISSSWPLRFFDLVCAHIGKMVEISVEAKFHYCVAGSVGVHNLCCFRSKLHR